MAGSTKDQNSKHRELKWLVSNPFSRRPIDLGPHAHLAHEGRGGNANGDVLKKTSLAGAGKSQKSISREPSFSNPKPSDSRSIDLGQHVHLAHEGEKGLRQFSEEVVIGWRH